MKLLIVDDEKLTREGIRSSLDLDALSISQVLLADDGIHGLDLALEEKPDIVLTDVRMPRMSGVQMVERLLEKQPDTAVIFMSAYSDKEYLKAAIKLKAVEYVEKPLDLKELDAALKKAVQNCLVINCSRSMARLHVKEQQSHLALLLMEPERSDPGEIQYLIESLDLPISASTYFSTMIIDCLTPLSVLPGDTMDRLQERFEAHIGRLGISQLYLFRADRYIVVHLYSAVRPEESALKSCSKLLTDGFQGVCHFFIARGPVVCGYQRAVSSSQKAWDLLGHSFFYERDSELLPTDGSVASTPPADVFMDFCVAIADKQQDQALEAADTLYHSIHLSPAMTPSQVRDLYYKYLGKLDENGMINHMSLWGRDNLTPESIWESVTGCATLSHLHQLLTGKIKLYFERLRQGSGENPVVFQVKEYLHKNYSVPTLSVPDVSQYVRLSSSYVCTLFKNETGQTLNQYLTDYRIKMSKQLLGDPRFKITDISSKVGYSDGNYYSKTFKKIVGLSPSEYREKMLS